MNWSEVNPRHFEKFVYHALGCMEFNNRQWFGRGGGDGGRDVCATWHEDLPFGLSYERKWIFQCKKWKRMPTTLQIYEEITKAIYHRFDHWVMVIPIDPTAGVIDYAAKLESNFRNERIRISIIPLAQIEEILAEYPELRNVLTEGTLLTQNGGSELTDES
ncbi:hypothetical protein COE58_25825 [Bacillus cereus]|nr:hypothetical protein COE58_25825 [Bacillus cereus]